MDLSEEYVKFCIQYAVENNFEDLEYFQSEQNRRAKEEKKPEPKVKLLEHLKNALSTTFKRMSYEEAIAICIKV